eukprot:2114553-Alexandrium_andersonii.AAC.1
MPTSGQLSRRPPPQRPNTAARLGRHGNVALGGGGASAGGLPHPLGSLSYVALGSPRPPSSR